jgi:c(7)-type cytochrome triheme protein
MEDRLSMRHAIAFFMAVALVAGVTMAAQDQKPPEKLVFPNKGGDAIFTHAAHIDREKGECATCHDTLWPRSTREPLTSSDGCRTCHRAGGRAFEMKGNCVKCHPSGGAKSAAR